MHNIAHRGASAYEPENTLLAFERAIALGATMLELDVWLSSDGHPVVIHDANLLRIACDPRSIESLTLAELKAFDVGYGERIPVLSEVIELARGRAELYIELKGQRTPDSVVSALHDMHFTHQAIVGSFLGWLPQRVKHLDTSIRTSVLIGADHRDADFMGWVLAVDANYVHPCWERVSRTPHKLLTPELISRIRARGLGIIVWHEERASELRELARLDVDGICTNTPDVLAEILTRALPSVNGTQTGEL